MFYVKGVVECDDCQKAAPMDFELIQLVSNGDNYILKDHSYKLANGLPIGWFTFTDGRTFCPECMKKDDNY